MLVCVCVCFVFLCVCVCACVCVCVCVTFQESTFKPRLGGQAVEGTSFESFFAGTCMVTLAGSGADTARARYHGTTGFRSPSASLRIQQALGLQFVTFSMWLIFNKLSHRTLKSVDINPHVLDS